MSRITLRELRILRESSGTEMAPGRNVGRIGHGGGKAAQLWDSEILKARRRRFCLEPPKRSASKIRRRARAARDMRQLKPSKWSASNIRRRARATRDMRQLKPPKASAIKDSARGWPAEAARGHDLFNTKYRNSVSQSH